MHIASVIIFQGHYLSETIRVKLDKLLLFWHLMQLKLCNQDYYGVQLYLL